MKSMEARATDPLQAIHTQVMWNRLIAVVEEQAQALLRTAFGSVAREAGDLSAGVYDNAGRMLAQAVTGTPGHVNSMAAAVAHFLQRFPVESMRPGDVYVTNDPWMGTGHLFDYVVVTPVFRAGAAATSESADAAAPPIALFGSTCHTVDVGGVGFSAEARSVFEEGTCIPHLRLASGGRLNEDLLAIIQANSRNPVEARGDILSLVSSNDVGAARLRDMMAEFGLTTIDGLAEHIIDHSRAATHAAIARLPRGTWRAHMRLDGFDAPIDLHAELHNDGRRIVVDYAGSSPASGRGINSPKCYTDAYSVFGLKCLIAPEVPNNAGSLEPFEVRATPGSIVHPLRPAPVTARHVVGQMLPDLMFGCLEAALDGQVPGESAGSIWVLAMSRSASTQQPGFNTMSVGLGGTGARPGKDGLSTTAFPSGVGAIPVEVTETQAPLVFWRARCAVAWRSASSSAHATVSDSPARRRPSTAASTPRAAAAAATTGRSAGSAWNTPAPRRCSKARARSRCRRAHACASICPAAAASATRAGASPGESLPTSAPD
jgi:N-methylhydantoinase B